MNLDSKKLLISIIGVQLVGITSGFSTAGSINNWYKTLTNPPLTPPNFVFGPVWTILYLLMGLSFYLIWSQKTKKNKEVFYKLFLAQLTLNFLWTFLFFGLRRPDLAFFDILVLDFFVIFTIYESEKINKTASYLLYPYLAWITFATYLNFGFLVFN